MFVLPSGLVFSAGSQGGMTRTLDVATGTWEDVDDCSICDACDFPEGNRRPVVAFEPGKILISGGGPATAMIIDFHQPAPAWGFMSSMNFSRTHHNGTLLPDGTILVTGGGSLATELCNPVDDTWTVMANMLYSRSEHSSAPLLPDGRVASREEDSSTLQV